MLFVILLTLSGCTNKEFKLGWYDKCLSKVVSKPERVYPEIPSEKLICDGIPKPGVIERDSDVSMYLIDLTNAGKSCESNLNYVRISLQKFKDDNKTK